MFSKAIFLTFLTLALSAFAAPANQNKKAASSSAAANAVCSVVSTVTVTAAAVSTGGTLINTGGGRGNNNQGGGAAGNGKGTGKGGNKASTSAAAAATSRAAGNTGNTGTGKGNTGKASSSSSSAAAAATSRSAADNGNNAQTSLTLNNAVIATGFQKDGQEVPAAGQVASLTSSNNFINFCLTVPNLPITNGQQVKTGSCNPAPMGVIASTSNMPSSKFQFPANFGTVKANTAFTIKMAVSHLQTGNFVNAQNNYFSAPQQINGAGDIKGHSHVVIEQIASFQDTKVTNPNVFAFFKGLNDAAQGGVLSADVTNGLPVGFYRLASINTAANHQPVLVAIAQHGSVDDMVYFQVTANGNANNNNANAGTGAGATSAAASSTAKASATAGTGTGRNGNGKGRGRRWFN
ncbi:hypothetical protein NLI96_g11093 [Meripilus lineatus]|uniref:Uncharacterized protein n=1 Tax=Meripilus lineatus TaxID=2056292 RepID=A0AAD5UXC6_9APHY|nr:hypothetical protein NLI96_g11093 [Physisporinus lineatus]